ncbi:hypothetical protein E4U55_007752 [Claviceps digitariae]|nr:hypothetical protein E4U55_007752 [Claviceps digitariae]
MNHAAPSRSSAASDDAAVALRGASLAFLRNPAAGSAATLASTTSPPEEPSSSSSSSSHRSEGVSLAVNSNSSSQPRSIRHATGAADSSDATAHKNDHSSHHTSEADASGYQASLVAARLHQLNGSSFAQQQQQQQQQPLVSVSTQRVHPKNPSFIAATLAASRGAGPSPTTLQPQQTSRRTMNSGLASETAASTPSDDAVDSESIPATGKLISLFEQGGGAGSARRRSPSLDAHGERLRGEKRGHERGSSVTSVKPRPAPKPKPKPKPKSKPSSAPPHSISPSPPPGDPPEAIPAAESEVETPAKRSNVVPSSRLPPQLMRSAERSTEKISAMPMPKPKLPPQLSLPFPQATGHNSLNHHQQQAQPRPSPSPPLPPSLSARPKPGSSRKSPSPSRRQESAVDGPRKVQHPRTPSLAGASATPESSSPEPVRLVRPVLPPPVVSRPSSPPQKNGSGRRNQGTASSPSRASENRPTASHSRASSPPNPRVSHQQRLVAGTGQRSGAGSRHREASVASVSHFNPTAPSSSRTEFGLPIVPFVPAPAPAPPPPRKALRREMPPPPLPRDGKRDSVASAPTSPVLAPHYSRRQLTQTSGNNNSSSNNLPLDPLTNAIMAGSLASAKLTPHNTGSSLPPPSLPQRQRSPRLLQTLRQPPGSQDDDPERVKIAHRHKLSSNKHAHQEGTRRRWRDQVTQRERKRYEAVWASNRGYSMFLHGHGHGHGLDHGHGRPSPPDPSHRSPDESECVFNVVVREIWKRSRLPQDELMEVWELVDRSHGGMLTRQEFVVGMWLIDQRLRGRKIPTRVSDSVWDSVNGVRLPQPRRK